MSNHLNANKTFDKADCKERSAPGLVGNEQEVQTNSAKLVFYSSNSWAFPRQKDKIPASSRDPSTPVPFKPLKKTRG